MATETSFDKEALKAAKAIHAYAESKKWQPQDYHIFITVRSDLFTLHITVVADQFNGRTEDQEFEDYDDVMDNIDRALKNTMVFNYYGLNLTGKEGFAFYPTPRLRDDEFEIDEKLINNGVSWSEPYRSRPR